jgi:hypothetical protein
MFERGLSFIHLLDLPAIRVALDRMAETTSCLGLEPSLPRNSCFLLRCRLDAYDGCSSSAFASFRSRVSNPSVEPPPE